jgi:hypothetical protein
MADPNATGFDVDAAEAEYEEARRAAGPADHTDLEPDGADEGGDKDPPGFLSFEEYTAQGGDPDMYRGRKAYESEHERINENKRYKRELRGLKNTVQQTMEAVNEWQGREREKIRGELEAVLHTAMEDEDPQAAVTAQKKLDKLDETPPPATRPEDPVILDFREAHPELDAESEDFNEELNADVEAFFNTLAKQLGQDGRRKLTDGQITRCLRKALKDAQELHGEVKPPADEDETPGESPRNQRRRGATPRRRARQTKARAKAEDFVLENPTNARQRNAAPEVRDMIKEKAVAAGKKAGLNDADAKKRGDEAAQRFEESLAR